MAVMGTVKVGQVVVARFDSDANSGSTIVQVGFVDNDKKAGPSGKCTSPPSGTGTTQPEVRATAKGSVKVQFTLPAGGSGVATVLVDGVQRDSMQISGTAVWRYKVEPS